MIRLGKVYTERGKHRLHERINTLLIVTSSIGIASEFIKFGKVTPLKPGEVVTVECIQLGMQVALPFVGPVETAVRGLTPDQIELDFRAKSIPASTASTAGFKNVIVHVVAALFGDFFEAHTDWLKSNFGGDPYQWPSIWNFGRVVRNSCAHGGMIYFDNKKADPVKWHNLEYSPSDNGRPVIFNDMAVGDFISLMFEMSEELDKMKCPII